MPQLPYGLRAVVLLGLSLCFPIVQAVGFDDQVIWPLCGRIAAEPPAAWQAQDGCPLDRAGDPSFSDVPLSSTYGPRQKASENFRYDFHRGIDIPTPYGTPVFALTAGEVRIAGLNPEYADALVQLRHWRPGMTSCQPTGCYSSSYHHLSSVAVQVGQQVSKGQLLGFTGASQSGFEHLHFEIRNAPGFDPYSAWQRDAIHPLRVLPQNPSALPRLRILNTELTGPVGLRVTLGLEQDLPAGGLGLVALGIRAFDALGNEIEQPGNQPDAQGYHVQPSGFHFEQANFEFTHKDSGQLPWESFSNCPYHDAHPPLYDPHVHMDRPAVTSASAHAFNGYEIYPAPLSAHSSSYQLEATFALNNVIPGLSCVQLQAEMANGQTVFQRECGLLDRVQLPVNP